MIKFTVIEHRFIFHHPPTLLIGVTFRLSPSISLSYAMFDYSISEPDFESRKFDSKWILKLNPDSFNMSLFSAIVQLNNIFNWKNQKTKTENNSICGVMKISQSENRTRRWQYPEILYNNHHVFKDKLKNFYIVKNPTL